MSIIKPLDKHYEPHEAAKRYEEAWQHAGYFKGDPQAAGEPFSIVIPPPNVTGSLHMGHALNNVLQDVLLRYQRMRGRNVVWIPGTDHASIAVHWLLEKQLKKEGLSRQEIGREAFLARAWQFKENVEANILNQQRRLGLSADWSRKRFTLDETLNKAVREAFVRLYEQGLIYQAEKLVHWDTVTQTTVSDLEVVYDNDVLGELFLFAYPLVQQQTANGAEAAEKAELVVATTRPETILGDTAIAVHPEDERYRHLIGRLVQHPFSQRQIPIIADAIGVDPLFGTGVVKITPAHDFNDFAMAQRHGLAMLNILHKDGTLNEQCGIFEGLTVAQAREQVKEHLAQMGLVRGCEAHRLNVGRSERSGVILEPLLSKQWYVRTKPLAGPAWACTEHGLTQFVPKQWQNTYDAWMRDMHDWCISRQLWWGHRLPIWTCLACKAVHALREDPLHCPACESTQLQQDPDVLDTWFSAALWPFSTMGWPEKTEDLSRFYPTALLVTGFDIIFFWVARMMMFGVHFMGQQPFKQIYIHALIRDASGQKMSKTKGNVIDPLAMIDVYGLDAFRFTLMAFAAQGRDIRWDEARLQGYHKFVNKIWQAFRFCEPHIQAVVKPLDLTKVDTSDFGIYHHWLLQRLAVTCQDVSRSLDNLQLSDAASAIYHFVWQEYCDWYLELSKTLLYNEQTTPKDKERVAQMLLLGCQSVCQIIYPFMPYLAEELWQHLPHSPGSVAQTSFPVASDYPYDAQAVASMADLMQWVVAVRRMRSEFNIAPKKPVQAYLRFHGAYAADKQQKFQQNQQQYASAMQQLAAAQLLLLTADPQTLGQSAIETLDGVEIFLPLADLIDLQLETQRLLREQQKAQQDLDKIAKQLSLGDFIAKAPQAVIEEKKAQQQMLLEKTQRLQQALQRLNKH